MGEHPKEILVSVCPYQMVVLETSAVSTPLTTQAI